MENKCDNMCVTLWEFVHGDAVELWFIGQDLNLLENVTRCKFITAVNVLFWK